MDFKFWIENTSNSVINSIVYHGTNRKFDSFSYQKSKRYVLFSDFDVEAKGFFFAESPHDALEYGNNVVACYVNMTNPLIDPRRENLVDRFPYKKEMDLMKILAPMIERKDGEPFIDLGVRRVYLKNRYYSYTHQWFYVVVGINGSDWDCLDNSQVIQKMKQLGYDGTFVEEKESNIGRSIFVPDASQIRIVQWFSGKQPVWGQKDDYYKNYKTGDLEFHPSNAEEEDA
mgnify:FL=1